MAAAINTVYAGRKARIFALGTLRLDKLHIPTTKALPNPRIVSNHRHSTVDVDCLAGDVRGLI